MPVLVGQKRAAAADGGETSITILTVTNASGSAKTNEPVEFGLPLAAGVVGAGQYVKLYDDDGSGNQGPVLGNYQLENDSTDLNSALRFVKGSAVIPSLAGSASRKLRAVVATGTAPANTPIAAGDILATAYEVQAQFDIGGTTFTASARTALGGGGSWSASTGKTDAVTHGSFRSNGACTEIICSMPPRSGGAGTEHASGDGLRVWFHIAAWKADAGAVSGGNPVTYVKTRVVLCNGALERASPANYYYGLTISRATSLSDGTLIATSDTDVDGNALAYSWPRSQPAATLTLSSASGGTRTATLSAGTWAADIKGAHLVNAGGNGKAYVTSRDSSTQVTIYTYQDFTATSYTSGNWTIEGVGHQYGWRWYEDVHVGTKPTNVCIPGNHTSAVTPTTDALRDYLRSTSMVSNYQVAIGGVSHDMSFLNATRTGSATIRPFTINGPEGTRLGDVETDQGKSGSRDDIGYLPLWDVNAICKYDANGRRKIFENGRWLNLEKWHGISPYTSTLSDGARGVPASPAAGLSYKFNPAHQQTNQINLPSILWNPYDGDISHMPAFGYIQYLMTGDLFWLETLQYKVSGLCTFGYNDAYNGIGANKTHFGSALRDIAFFPFGENQMRGMAWGMRDVAHACICTPDSARDLLYIPKATLKTHVTKSWDAARSGDLNTGGSGSGFWQTSGPRFTNGGGSDSQFGSDGVYLSFQLSYLIWCLGNCRELGLSDSDFDSFLNWLAVGPEEAYSSSDVAPDYITTAYTVPFRDFGGASLVKTWANVYRNLCVVALHNDLGGNNVSYGGRRAAGASGNVTLSATSGASVTVTLPAAALTNGATSFYADGTNGGWFYQHSNSGISSASNIVAFGRITAVSASHGTDREFTIDTTGSAAFSSTTLGATVCSIPAPHPLDAAADGTRATDVDADYQQLYALICNYLIDFGRGTPAVNAKAYMTGSVGYTTPSGEKNHYNVANR